ncbi:Endoribonuclease YbeY [Candidatus Karelsulcia muelleri]|uniref:rRNA maturation RNase YbeY n=1 Tax=Candidatus Karelsulcia muelleri TaxID=336810 RepID=UPI001FF6FC1B|nr:rRNA maturation RNase YbeY [Candidatus Karelsulcia muelleri]UOQ27707.1 Endoribonuclease YbeY [Candidatus Karelsulcia muelleri]UOQ32923.1 Endoribonuclease YbeY [Candidatus Karelsulcia muelleri]
MIYFSFYYKFSFKKKIEKILRYEKSNFIKIIYIFCNNKYISTLNFFVFKKTKLTDVITLKKTDRNKKKVGEIYINIDMIKFNSIVFKKTFYEELKRVMIHGVLHLIGYEDNNKQIAEKEKFYLCPQKDLM